MSLIKVDKMELRELYRPANKPSTFDVPTLSYLTIEGQGGPQRRPNGAQRLPHFSSLRTTSNQAGAIENNYPPTHYGKRECVMRALLVYESMFGNTEQIAIAVRRGLDRHGDVEVVEVSEAPNEIDDSIDLLVVGAPTHAFGLSRPNTRKSAAEYLKPLVSRGRGVREWLEGLTVNRTGVAAACFGTRVGVPRLPGTAGHTLRRKLRRLGFRQPLPMTDFLVDGMEGPVTGGEFMRAEEWGDSLGRQIVDQIEGAR
jgi:hypothetical protein